MHWLYLGTAVLFEIGVAFAAGRADGFTRRGWTAATLVSGAAATYGLSRALLTFDVGVGYALWTSIAGVGITVVGSLLGQRMTGRQLVGVGVVIVGVVGLQLSGAAR